MSDKFKYTSAAEIVFVERTKKSSASVLIKADDPDDVVRNRPPAERVRTSLNRLTDRERAIYRSVQDAVAALSRSADSALVRRLIAEGVESVLGDISLGGFVSELQPMVDALTSEVIRGAVNNLGSLPNDIGMKMRFDYLDPRAVAWANQRAGELIRTVTDEQRNVLRNVISEGIQDQITVDEMARNVRDVIGLPDTWAEAVPRARDSEFVRLIGAGKSIADATRLADSFADRYKTRLVNARAKTIARTEIMSAQNQGRFLSWAQAAEQGFIPKNAKKEWIAAPGFGPPPKLCERCKDIAGVTAQWDEPFPGTEVLIPPLHPNCRCTAVLVPFDVDQLERLLKIPQESYDLAAADVAAVMEVEPDITGQVAGLAEELGGETVGLENRLKSQNSLARKAYFDSLEKGVSVEEAMAAIRDKLRYTIQIPGDRYAEGVRDVLIRLQQQGVEVKSKIRWSAPDVYRGVNLQIKDPRTGVWYELQFHTPESLKAKGVLHEVFEQWRTLPDSDPKKAALFQQMVDMASDIPNPTNIGELLALIP